MNRYYISILGLVLTFLFFSACNGQVNPSEQYRTSQKASKGQLVDSLPSSIWSMYQDRENHFWFGSNGQGVFHYDGERLMNFTKADGLADNQIRGIQSDASGNIFFDTPGGITKFDGLNFIILRSLRFVDSRWQSRPDDLWFEGDGNENVVYRYDGKDLHLLSFPKQDLQKAFGIRTEEDRFSPYGVYGIYRDQKDNMWFGTLTAGVFRFDGNDFLWIGEKELSQLEDGRVPGVRAMIEDQNGHFWLSNIRSRYEIITGENGNLQYKKLTGIATANIKGQIELSYFQSALVNKKTGDLWMCSYNEGVWRYNGKELLQTKIMDGNKAVQLICLFQDHQGTIWLGTNNAGVYQFDGNQFKKFSLH